MVMPFALFFWVSVLWLCRLRCFIWDYGREKVIELVNCRREKELEEMLATGTDGMMDAVIRKKYTEKQKEAYRYADTLYIYLSAFRRTFEKEIAGKD